MKEVTTVFSRSCLAETVLIVLVFIVLLMYRTLLQPRWCETTLEIKMLWACICSMSILYHILGD